jgi:hypothetical protein
MALATKYNFRVTFTQLGGNLTYLRNLKLSMLSGCTVYFAHPCEQPSHVAPAEVSVESFRLETGRTA